MPAFIQQVAIDKAARNKRQNVHSGYAERHIGLTSIWKETPAKHIKSYEHNM